MQERDKRNFVRRGVVGLQLPSAIKFTLKLPVSVRLIQQVLSMAPQVKYMKRKPAILLRPAHMSARAEWTREELGRNSLT